MSNEREKDSCGVRFNDEEIKFIDHKVLKEVQAQNDIYFDSIHTEIKGIRPGVVEDVTGVIMPMINDLNALKKRTTKAEDQVKKHEGWLWVLTAATTIIIIALLLWL